MSRAAPVGRLILFVQSPDLYDLHAVRFEPGQKPVQGGLILKGALFPDISGELVALGAILLVVSALAISRYKVTLD